MGRVLDKRLDSRSNPSRSRPKKNQKRKLNNWDPVRMEKAINEFQEGKLSLRQISLAWNIPKSTLQRHLTGKVKHNGHASGRPTALSQNNETDLAEYLKDLSRHGFLLCPLDVRSLAYQFSVKNSCGGIGSEKTMMAGRFWFKRFMKNHPELSLRWPEGLSAARAMGCNKEVVSKWFAMEAK